MKEKFHLGFDLIYYDIFKKNYYSISILNNINDKTNLLMSLSNIRESLNDDNIFNSIFSGFSGAVIINNKLYDLGIGLSSLGDAGYFYCISFDFK